MKKKQLLLVASALMTAFSFGQNLSDLAPEAQQEHAPSINSSIVTPKTVNVGGAIVNGNILPCDSTSTTLTVTGSCSWEWYSDANTTNLLGTDVPLTVSNITADTTLYLLNQGATGANPVSLPAQSSTFSGNVRGYWFQAPSDFYITGATVPTTASSGNSNIAIVKFNSGPPPSYSTTTNDFTLLELWQNNPNDTLTTCIPVSTGDYIGVLGNRADVNSYGGGSFVTTIDGNAVTLERLGMQFNLSTTSPQDLWQEPGGSISRVTLLTGNLGGTPTVDSLTIYVPYPTAHTTTASICQGDSIYLGGAYQTVNGNYVDTLATISGCDSVLTTVLSVGTSYNYINNIDICQGDSVMIGGTYYSSPGVVLETLQTVLGCDSTVTNIIQYLQPDVTVAQSTDGVTLTANASGVSYQWLDCDNGNAPISGATNQSFTATTNGNYAVQITENGCSDVSACIEVNSVGIAEVSQFGFNVYPNPTKDVFNFTFDGQNELTIELNDLNGKILWSETTEDGSGSINVSNYAVGTYLLKVTNGTTEEVIRVVKH